MSCCQKKQGKYNAAFAVHYMYTISFLTNYTLLTRQHIPVWAAKFIKEDRPITLSKTPCFYINLLKRL